MAIKFPACGAFFLASTLSLLLGCHGSGTVASVPSPSFEPPHLARANALPPAQSRTATPSQTQTAPLPQTRLTTPLPSGPREWQPAVAARPWRCIVIHHSATTTGGAVAFDKMHRAKGWDELGYDFVIGNGSDTADGQIEVGPRWTKQKVGAHAKTPDNHYNEYGIGICLVGNFDVERPTVAQMKSLSRLVVYLMKTYRISANQIVGHGETKNTDCPGRHLNVPAFRNTAAQLAGKPDEADATTASATLRPGTELLKSTHHAR